MPVVAAAILQRIADFLAIGATPQASPEAGDGFSVLLARNAAAPTANQTDETGKTLPLDRQDLAAQTIDLPTTNLDMSSETPTAEAASPTIASPDAMPSTAAMLNLTDPLAKAVITVTTPETQGVPAQPAMARRQSATKAETTSVTAPARIATATLVDLPEAPVLAQTTDGPQGEPITSPATARTVEIASPVAVEVATSTTFAAVAAEAPETTESAEMALPAQQSAAKPQHADADRRASRLVKADRQPIDHDISAPKSEATSPDVASAGDRTTSMPLPIATATIDAPISLPSETSRSAADQRAPIATAAAAPAAVPTTQADTTARTAGEQPAPISTATATAPTQSVAPTVTAQAATGVTFIARSTRPITAKTPAPQPVETAVATSNTETAAPAAANATAPAERETPPFRATAVQILAAQPATADAPRATEAETRVRTPATETAPTIAQQLAPASHGGERAVPTAAPTAAAALSTEQAAALIETIQMLRSEAKSDAMTLAVDHDQLGKITMRFERTDHGVEVRIDSPDPAVTQLIANASPGLRASGDNVGMRFDRQDAAGSGSAGTSRDAPRQGAGQDRNPTPYEQSSRPRASGQRDGLFA